jgi:hypothetical protein
MDGLEFVPPFVGFVGKTTVPIGNMFSCLFPCFRFNSAPSCFRSFVCPSASAACDVEYLGVYSH